MPRGNTEARFIHQTQRALQMEWPRLPEDCFQKSIFLDGDNNEDSHTEPPFFIYPPEYKKYQGKENFRGTQIAYENHQCCKNRVSNILHRPDEAHSPDVYAWQDVFGREQLQLAWVHY